MIQSELQTLIKSGDVGKVVLNRVREIDAPTWEVWAYDEPNSGNRTCKSFDNRLIVQRTKQPKTYTSLDRAWSAMRELGYSGPIDIDG